MLAQSASGGGSVEDGAAEPDAEVSFVTRELTTILPRVKIGAAAPLDEILARVREAASWDGSSQKSPLINDSIPLTAYAPERADPYGGFELRIVPENVTLLPKTTAQVTGGNAWSERTFALKKGDSVSAILKELGATPDDSRRSPRHSAAAAGITALATDISYASCSPRVATSGGSSRFGS